MTAEGNVTANLRARDQRARRMLGDGLRKL